MSAAKERQGRVIAMSLNHTSRDAKRYIFNMTILVKHALIHPDTFFTYISAFSIARIFYCSLNLHVNEQENHQCVQKIALSGIRQPKKEMHKK